MDYPAPEWLQSNAGELRMPFSDTVKYCILGVSVALLLLALSILAWQIIRCCTETHTAVPRHGAAISDPLHSVEKTRTVGNCSGAPSTRVRRKEFERCGWSERFFI
ncbi:hypothetical protein EYF80_018664 [Liparis tanakae]|uniref:Uncharacterized protein n=1 Tax=Liparis tanakae TaxID=230148 RepID=A0A4Z2I1I2_9TELE|nr:hypothetical protein EYF80_018664 [Liparis tanakae]